MASTINASTSPAAIVQTADGTGILSLQTGNTTALTIDASQNVGIGTTSPVGDVTRYLNIVGSGGAGIFLHDSNQGVTASDGTTLQAAGVNTYLYNREAGFMAFGTSNTERMRIDGSGNVLVNKTSQSNTGKLEIDYSRATHAGSNYNETSSASSCTHIAFQRGGTSVGSIQSANNSSTSYNTSSDYRLKENIVPMTGALATVTQLKPVTYTWKVDGSDGQGFIAHELAEVVPDCVSGEKDAVDEEGNIKPQGIDTSFLVATLTAAIQELAKASSEQQALITSLTARITALEGASL